jgi:hypothetical protein
MPPFMGSLLEYAGCVHIFLGPYRGNPIALYLKRGTNGCEIGPRIYPWNEVVGKGETPNRAAADFEEKWKAKGLAAEMYTGPAWEGGIKPEKPAPPKPAAAPKPATPPQTPAAQKTDAAVAAPPQSAPAKPAPASKPEPVAAPATPQRSETPDTGEQS